MDFRIGSACKGLKVVAMTIVGVVWGVLHLLERRSQLEYNVGVMKTKTICPRLVPSRRYAAILAAGLLCGVVGLARVTNAGQSSASDSQDSTSQPADKDKGNEKSSGQGTTRLRIQVTDGHDKPVGNASVYVRYYTSGGFLHREKLAELDFKTNQDGSVKVPEVPQGKILIQVIAKGWHTYGKWYDVEEEEESVPIKLEPPPHWY
jgi:hypothetical protein